MRFLIVFAVLALCACADHRQQDASDCQEYGYQPGTDGYAQCRMQLNAMHQAKQAEADRNVANMYSAYSLFH